MSDAQRGSTDDAPAGHPSQAEGEDPAKAPPRKDPAAPGHPSQAEGEDEEHG